MTLAAPLQRFVDDEMARMPMIVEPVLRQTIDALRQAPQGALNAAERMQRFEFAQTLQTQSRQFVQAFVAAFARRVQGGDNVAAAQTAPMRGLALLDESTHNADIEIARVATQIDGVAEWELRELQTFTSALCGLPYVSVSTNPLHPEAFAHALWQAGCALGSAQEAALLLRHASMPLAEALKKEFASACTRLEAQGVQPSLYRTAVPPRAESTRASLLTGLLESAAPPHVAPTQRPTATLDAQTRGLLHDLFDASAQSSQMHPALRALTTSLHASALELAAHDPQLLESASHPLWTLLDRFAYQSATHPDAADPQLRAWVGYATELVAALERAPLQGAELYRDCVAKLDAYSAAQFNAQLLQAAGDIDALARNAPVSIAMDLGTMDTVPADLLAASATDAPGAKQDPDADADTAVAAWLEAQQPGAWYRMFLRGRWGVARLLWCSDARSRWLFASPHPQRNDAFEHATLLRLRAEKLIRPFVERAVVVRAAESVRRRLADKRTTR
jgi:hypothetical protein